MLAAVFFVLAVVAFYALGGSPITRGLVSGLFMGFAIAAAGRARGQGSGPDR